MTNDDLKTILDDVVRPAMDATEEGRSLPLQRLAHLNRAIRDLLAEKSWSFEDKMFLEDLGELSDGDASRLAVRNHHLDKLRALLRRELVRRSEAADSQSSAPGKATRSADVKTSTTSANAPNGGAGAATADKRPAKTDSLARKSWRGWTPWAAAVIVLSLPFLYAWSRSRDEVRQTAALDPCPIPGQQRIPHRTASICVSPAFADYLACIEGTRIEEVIDAAKRTVRGGASAGDKQVQASTSAEESAVGTVTAKYSKGPQAEVIAACTRKFEGVPPPSPSPAGAPDARSTTPTAPAKPRTCAVNQKGFSLGIPDCANGATSRPATPGQLSELRAKHGECDQFVVYSCKPAGGSGPPAWPQPT